MDVFLVELVVVFVVAVLVGVVFRYFGLPSIIGHVLAGIVLGVSGIISSPSRETMTGLGTLGVTLLLFLVGLEMNWEEIKKVGKDALLLFGGQLVLLTVVYTVFGLLVLGFSLMVAVLFSMAMTFSSTIVVVKVLSEKKEINSYSGKLSLGILLLQDIGAILLLVFLPSVKQGLDWGSLGLTMVKLGAMVLLVNVAGHYFISMIMKYVIKTAEDLVLFSLAWFAVVIYSSVSWLHLSPEIGGLLAGLSLSTGWGHFQIVSKIRILRDVFLTLFFVLLGFEVGMGDISWYLVLILIPVIVLVKFMVTHFVARLVGLGGRTAILLGINMTQLSEFGLVVMATGYTLGVWSGAIVNAVTLAGLICMVLSTVLINVEEEVSITIAGLSKKLFSFQGKNRQTKVGMRGHVVLFGADRTGKSILSFLKRQKEKVVVVDFNPQVVADLKERGWDVIFADATDPDVVDLVNLVEAKLVISTMKSLDDSLALLSSLRNSKIGIPVIMDAESLVQAKKLYQSGASYVIFPHFVSGWHLGQIIKHYGRDKSSLGRFRLRQDNVLKEAYEGEY